MCHATAAAAAAVEAAAAASTMTAMIHSVFSHVSLGGSLINPFIGKSITFVTKHYSLTWQSFKIMDNNCITMVDTGSFMQIFV